jgi:serpin B
MIRKLALPFTAVVALIAVLFAAGAAQSARPHKQPSNASAAAAVDATNALGLRLLPRLGGNGNVVFSPYSIQAALAMLAQGAAGSTATEIDQVLGGQSTIALAGANGELADRLYDAVAAPTDGPAAQRPTLLTANGLWVQSGLPLEQPFQSTLQQDVGAAPRAAEFATDPDSARQAINSWVAGHTAQLIKNLMPPGSITSQTALVLANAIYLKAQWENPFVKASTANGPFFIGAGRHVTAPFMTEPSFQALYGSGAGYRAIQLPYASSTLSLLAVMPAQGTLGSFERHLTPGALGRLVNALGMRNVNVEMPRLKLLLHTSLNQTLESLGMPDAFGPMADFSGITRKVSLQIQQVEHGAYMRVDEAGTVAAAATGISTMPTAVYAGPAVHLSLNRPFLLFLRDDSSGAILFAGRVINPAAS